MPTRVLCRGQVPIPSNPVEFLREDIEAGCDWCYVKPRNWGGNRRGRNRESPKKRSAETDSRRPRRWPYCSTASAFSSLRAFAIQSGDTAIFRCDDALTLYHGKNWGSSHARPERGSFAKTHAIPHGLATVATQIQSLTKHERLTKDRVRDPRRRRSFWISSAEPRVRTL